MSDDVVAETMSFDAFERLLASAPSTSATTTLECERSSPTLERSRAVVASHGAVATSSDAYGAYVSFMRSGLWRDVAPRRDAASGGTIYMLCEPRDAPTERRRGEPRAKRPRSVAIPFAVSRACVTPAFLDVALTLGGTRVDSKSTRRPTDAASSQRATCGRARPPPIPLPRPSATCCSS